MNFYFLLLDQIKKWFTGKNREAHLLLEQKKNTFHVIYSCSDIEMIFFVGVFLKMSSQPSARLKSNKRSLVKTMRWAAL